ncbi:MAG: hypothetical protein KBD56_01080 [Candidatus Eisenbacteria bacterium]|nr:hypothetical protein [Candidatus Eisenbacteria bacterium]
MFIDSPSARNAGSPARHSESPALPAARRLPSHTQAPIRVRGRIGSLSIFSLRLVVLLALAVVCAASAAWAGGAKNKDMGEKEEADAKVVLLNSELPPIDRKLPDGFYLVLRSGIDRKQLGAVADSERLVFQRPHFLPKDAEAVNIFFVISARPAARLVLASPASWVADGENPHLLLPLSASTLEGLAALAQRKAGEWMALVVGGEVVHARQIASTPAAADYEADCAKRRACQHVLQLLRRDVKTSAR